ncbi:aspartate dehydrogenase [Bacillus sp. FJAT-45350]|uniref:aspartate dehydrogenase n=1 Tax=Bacillus sp. FJAT-45350 TaxID=2011014 RepID=UPI000BB8FC22|nr:aspartate dehydrogenase [Bacillus sp. FJAT-45350]
MKIGLIGSGNISEFLLDYFHTTPQTDVSITALFSRNIETTQYLATKYQVTPFHSFEEFMHSDIDVVIEAANITATIEYAPKLLKNGKDILIISVGAFAEPDFSTEVARICNEHGTKVYLPSGAIGGLDVLKAAVTVDGLKDVSIVTRKPANSLTDEPITEPKVLFEGYAKEAIKLFPKNINVSIILSLVGLGIAQTKVKIIADPGITKNIHTIEATGEFGTLSLNIENNPMPGNPKTSFLAALSILSTLKEIEGNMSIG